MPTCIELMARNKWKEATTHLSSMQGYIGHMGGRFVCIGAPTESNSGEDLNQIICALYDEIIVIPPIIKLTSLTNLSNFVRKVAHLYMETQTSLKSQNQEIRSATFKNDESAKQEGVPKIQIIVGLTLDLSV